jgi:hypothetical protein
MKEELLKLANGKGYFSNFYNVEYYLWLCSLQNWLRNKHNIHVFIQPRVQEFGNAMGLFGRIWLFDKRWITSHYVYNDNYDSLLETLLYEALKLIKK